VEGRPGAGVAGEGQLMRSRSGRVYWPIHDDHRLGGAGWDHPFKEVTATAARSN